MRRIWFVLLTSAALFPLGDALNACGEKFALPGRGLPYGHAYAAVYPARILIAATARAGGSPAIRDAKFPSTLSVAGHQVVRMDNRTLIDEAIKSGKVDLVIADLDDADALMRDAESSSGNAIVLPVMTAKPTTAAVKACRSEFGARCELKASDKPDRFLTAIDDAMEARAKAMEARAKAQKTRKG